MENISISIPTNYTALMRASDMLHEIAVDMKQAAKMNTLPVKHADSIDLDSDGFPWDHRIHAFGQGGTHPKLKKTQQWKKKRGVSDDIIAEVEAELREALEDIEQDVETAEPTMCSPVPMQEEMYTYKDQSGRVIRLDEEVPVLLIPPTETVTPVPAVLTPASPTIADFPSLMKAITLKKPSDSEIDIAVNKHGLSSLPLLAAPVNQPLIGLVAQTLGL